MWVTAGIYLGGMSLNNSASSLASCSSVFCDAISCGVGGGSHDEIKRRDLATETFIVAWIAPTEGAVDADIGELSDFWRCSMYVKPKSTKAWVAG